MLLETLGIAAATVAVVVALAFVVQRIVTKRK